MTLKYSRKRDKVYLRKLHYLKSFLNLLHAYRVHLTRKQFHQITSTKLRAIECRYHSSTLVSRQRQCRFFVTNKTSFYRSRNVTKTTEIILCVYGLKMLLTSFIIAPGFHFIEPSELDKCFVIDLRDARNFLNICEMEIVPKIQPNSTYFLRSGQMLVNWFLQSLQTVSNALTTNLSESDHNVLAYQFCNSLLTAGVIRKLDETSTESGFKVCAKQDFDLI